MRIMFKRLLLLTFATVSSCLLLGFVKAEAADVENDPKVAKLELSSRKDKHSCLGSLYSDINLTNANTTSHHLENMVLVG